MDNTVRRSYAFSLGLFFIILSNSFVAFASKDEEIRNPYKFVGSCSSQGEWTAQALYNSEQIKGYINQLKDDPNCKALNQELIGHLDESIQSIQKLREKNSEISKNPGLMNLPKELSELQSVLKTMNSQTSNYKSGGLYSLLKGTHQMLSAESSNPVQAELLKQFKQRVDATAETAFANFSVFTSKLPQTTLCLTDANALSSLLSMSVQTVSAFLQSGASLNANQLAKSIAQISETARQVRFDKITSEINKAQFLQSMSCIMEITSESYCSARDSYFLQANYLNDYFVDAKSVKSSPQQQNTSNNKVDQFFKTVNKIEKTNPAQAQNPTEQDIYSFRAKLKSYDQKLLDPKNMESADFLNNPSYGLFILSHHVSNINQWVQEIQLGVDPKLDTDATFKNRVLDTANVFLQRVNTLKGEVSKRMVTIQNEPKLQTKKTMVLQLIDVIVDNLVNMRNTDQNFFTAQVPAIQIPFVLTGIPIPPQVSGNTNGAFVQRMNYDDYFQVNVNSIEQFNDPATMLKTIESNLNLIIMSANSSMIEYYNKWFIVDKTLIIQKSLTGVNYSIYDSFVAIRAYLKHLVVKIRKYGHGSLSETQLNIPGIEELIARLDKVIAAYEPVKNLSQLMSEKKIEIKECKEQITTATDSSVKNKALPSTQMIKTISKDCLTNEALQNNLQLNLITLNSTSSAAISTQAVVQIYSKIVETVFEEFIVLLARSSFISNRMKEYVESDFIISKKSNVDFSKYENEILATTGRILIERVSNMTSGNITAINLDLQNAMSIHKQTNLYANEQTFKAYLMPFLRQMKLATEHSEYNDFDIFMRTNSDIMNDFTLKPLEQQRKYKNTLEDKKSSLWEKLKSALGYTGTSQSYYSRKLLSALWVPMAYLLYSDRYDAKNPFDLKLLDSNKRNGDTEFGSLKTLLAKYCTQVLAFNGWYEYKSICQNEVLFSPLYKNIYQAVEGNKNRDQILNQFNMYYSVMFNHKGYEYLQGAMPPADFVKLKPVNVSEAQFRSGYNQSQRICALRDYLRRNQALILTTETATDDE